MSTLDLEPSRAIYETVGHYGTECTSLEKYPAPLRGMFQLPRPTFGEVLRQVNVLASTLKTDPHDLAHSLTDLFWNATTEKAGMRAVGDYLLKLLKQ